MTESSRRGSLGRAVGFAFAVGGLVACSNPEKGLDAVDLALLDAIAHVQGARDLGIVGRARPGWIGDQTVLLTVAGDQGPEIVAVDRGGGDPARFAEGAWPIVSPDGQRIAAISDRGRLLLFDADSEPIGTDRVRLGDALEIADLTGAPPIVWHADSARFVVLTARRQGSRLASELVVVGRDGQVQRRVGFTRYAAGAAWLSDTELLVVAADVLGGLGSQLWRLDLATGSGQAFGPELGLSLWPPVYDPERRTAVVVQDLLVDQDLGGVSHYGLVEVDVDDGEAIPLNEDVTFVWFDTPMVRSSDGDLWVATRRSTLPHAIQRFEDATRLSGERRLALQHILGLAPSASTSHFAWVGADLDGSIHLRAGPSNTFSSRDLLTVRSAPPAALPVAEVSEITWEIDEGVLLGGLVVHDPSNTEPRPLWVDIHDGPEGGVSLEGSLFLSTPLEWHHRVARGFTVFVPDYRSSGVAGLAARRPEDRAIPVADVDDVLAGIDRVIERYPIDEGRIVVVGHGAGASVVQHALVQTDRFAAAIIKESGLRPADEVDRSGPTFTWSYGAAPGGAVAAFEASYPFLHAGGITAPTLLVAGGSRGDGGSADVLRAFADAIEAGGGGPVELFVARGEGPVFEKRRSNARLLAAVEEFLERFVR